MKINIVTRKLIQPRAPTPPNLKNYKISFRDELSPPSNVGFVLFYHTKPESLDQIEESLSEILPQFYPLAGRYINDNFTVDCSDQGAEFVVAVATDGGLGVGEVECLFPRPCDRFVGKTDPLLAIQITELVDCGGLAIGTSVSHRIFDASSIATFVAAWSNANRAGQIRIVPSFESRLLFPGKNLSYYPETRSSSQTTILSKQFLFRHESITKLRSKLRAKQGVQNSLSKIRIISALIAKALIHLDRINHGRPRPCLIVQAVDMRHRTVPPLPKHSCGNLVLHSVARCTQTKTDLGVQELVGMIGDAIEKTVSDCAKILPLGEIGYRDLIINPEVELIEGLKSNEVTDLWFTDWSKFGLYDVDFGWGKPVSVGMAPVPYERVTVLMNDKDGGGIEAWVHLKADDMHSFEEDEDIKLFTKNPFRI